MRAAAVLCVALAIAALAAAGDEKYTARFDNIDVDSILSNDRLLSNYVKCLKEQGPCTQEGQALKKVLAEALTTDCQKCTDPQKKMIEKVIPFLKEHHPEDFEELAKKYDPSRSYAKKHGI